MIYSAPILHLIHHKETQSNNGKCAVQYGITTTRKEESQQLLAYPVIVQLSVSPSPRPSPRNKRMNKARALPDVVRSNLHVDEITSNTDILQHLKLQTSGNLGFEPKI